jgi:hypothetical protein
MSDLPDQLPGPRRLAAEAYGGAVTIFKLVKITLDELYTQRQRRYGPTLDDMIKKRSVDRVR